MADDKFDPWDAAAQSITSNDAYSRFTRAPIKLSNYDRIIQAIHDKLDWLGAKPTTRPTPTPDNPSSGEYDPSKHQIFVNLHGQHPTYSDMQTTLHHEDIHAALAQYLGANKAPTPNIIDTSSFGNMLKSLWSMPSVNAVDAFYRGHRAGDPALEVPAYMGAYKPGELPGMTPKDREMYLHGLYATLPDGLTRLLKRIVASHDASQGAK